MPSPARRIEEVFLKISNVVILVVMTLAIVASVVLAGMALWDYSKSPQEPVPAQKAPTKEIDLGELIKNFEQAAKAKEQAKQGGAPKERPPEPAVPSLRYLEQVTKLYRCSTEFAKSIGAEVEASSAEEAQRVEQLRAQIERIVVQENEGEEWLNAAVAFTCTALSDQRLIKLRSDGKVDQVFLPTVRFHLSKWRQIRAERQAFETREANRVASERAAEGARILEAKLRAVTFITAAGASFGAFMLLAFFLLAWKIEANLRDINHTIQSAVSSK